MAESIAFMERAAAVWRPSAKRASPTRHSIRLRSALSPASRDWVEQTMFVVEGYGTRQAGVDAALNVLSACPRIGLLPNKTGHDRPDIGGRSDLGDSEPGSPSAGGEAGVTPAFLGAVLKILPPVPVGGFGLASATALPYSISNETLALLSSPTLPRSCFAAASFRFSDTIQRHGRF
jgi:hypothetical protein